jgi:hypothetical protein
VHLLTSVCLSSIDLCFVVVITPRPLIITAHHTTHRPAPCAACFAAPRAHVDSPLRPRDRRLPTSLLGSGFERTLDLSPSTTIATTACCPTAARLYLSTLYDSVLKEDPGRLLPRSFRSAIYQEPRTKTRNTPNPTITSKGRSKRDLWDRYCSCDLPYTLVLRDDLRQELEEIRAEAQHWNCFRGLP